MKIRYLFLGAAIVLQLALAFMPIIPGINGFVPKDPSAKERLDTEVGIMGIGFAILTACFGVMTLVDEKDRDRFQDDLKKILPTTKIEKLRDDYFYSQFLVAAKHAKSTVNIMYLAVTPPDYAADTDRVEYYRSLLRIIKRKHDVRFNRIVRGSDANKEWIGTLMRDLEEVPNASICMVEDNQAESMPLTLSTQIIDNQKVWFVAIQDHERRGPYRDMSVENTELAEGMAFYYERIWKRGRVLLENGRITHFGAEYIAPA